MSDYDRFTAFLREAAARYNAPPDTPAEAMWDVVERTLETRAPSADEAVVPGPEAYHEPPEPPREAMWERIEAAWALHRSVRPTEADAVRVVGGGGPRGERRSVALWLSALAVAASLVIGIALGRGTLGLGGGLEQVAVEGGEPAVPAAVDSGIGPTLPETRVADETSEGEPLETAIRLAAQPEDVPSQPAIETSEARPAADLDARRDRVARYATARHLGRAETLLTAFRSEAEVGPDELASWARELLGETRLLLDMSVERPASERMLLEELELLLAQIARLGPETPGFERELITEGLERQGTIAQLRSVSAGT